MGLSATYWPGRKTIFHALDQGVNLFFAYGFDLQMVRTLREVVRTDRERTVLITGAYNLIWTHQNVRKTLEKRLRQFGTDYIDSFLFLGVMKGEQLTERVLEELQSLKDEGKVRRIGMSCHDRKFAGQLATEGVLDTFMIRYNAAHRGADQDVFPHLGHHDPAVISYTATRWGYLMRRPRGYPKQKRIPSPVDCYRFVLSNPNVDVVLTAPSNLNQLKQNLTALEKGPMSAEDMEFMGRFGDLVRARNKRFLGG
jgi:aryl-alcohol dehydrogenase-like predicted oxidoreductase